jgi:hypothetical protein
MRRLVPISLLAALVVSLAAAAGAQGKLIARGTDSGEVPVTTANGAVKKPRTVTVQVSASTASPVELTADISCNQRFKTRSREREIVGQPPFTLKLPMPFRRPERCLLGAFATFVDFTPGQITIEIFARR